MTIVKPTCAICRAEIRPGETLTESRMAHSLCAIVELAVSGRDMSAVIAAWHDDEAARAEDDLDAP